MPPPRGLIQWVDQELHRNGLLPRGGRLLVAVSGGADSVGLLRILCAVNRSRFWRWALVVGHVDHGIRGAASVADAKFVERLAEELGLRCVMRRLRLKKNSSEALARAGRLRALSAMVRAEKCDGAVMGHHADDQAETVLLRIMRGCGMDGLAGIRPRSSVGGLKIYRPLLSVRRAAISSYLTEIGQCWCEDETNRSNQYLRNRVRSDVLPVLEKLAPRVVEAVGRTATLAGEAGAFINGESFGLLCDSLVAQSSKKIVLKRIALRWVNPFLCGEVLREALVLVGGSSESADFERMREAIRVVQADSGGKTVQLGGGVMLRVGAGMVVVERAGGGGK